MDATQLICLEPIINRNSKVLILGSMPGPESLRKNQYYANSRNHFWKIIYSVFGMTPEESYIRRLLFLEHHNIALWDSISSCERQGALDSDIKNEQSNDFIGLFTEYTNIEAVVFNGKKSYEVFRKNVGLELLESLNILYKTMPSTSPANAISFEKKLEEWKWIKNFF